jgi:hypothetical protein
MCVDVGMSSDLCGLETAQFQTEEKKTKQKTPLVIADCSGVGWSRSLL